MIYLVGYHFQKDFPLPNSLLKTPEPRPEEPPVTQTVMGKRVLLSDLYLISWHTGSSFQNRMERLFGNVVVDGVLSTTLAPSTMLLRFLMVCFFFLWFTITDSMIDLHSCSNTEAGTSILKSCRWRRRTSSTARPVPSPTSP